MKSILFVCLGNICRSPVVAAVARVEFARAGLDIAVASAGIADYHVGDMADARAIASAEARGYAMTMHRARQLAAADFSRYDAILAMDCANLRAIDGMRPQAGRAETALFLAFAGIPSPAEVPDPYYRDAAAFDRVVELARAGVQGLIARSRNDA